MATKTIIHHVDDLDGSEATTTVRFSLDGADYEIDLSDGNALKLRNALQGYVGAGRKLGRVNGQRAKHYRNVPTGPDNHAVRAWAKSRGIEVSDRGRLSAHLVEQFEEANSPKAVRPERETSSRREAQREPAKPKAAPRKRAARKVAAAK